jgi:hypothetical protein
MLDFFTNVQPLQLVLVGIGLFLVFPHIRDMFKNRNPKTPADRLVLDDPDHNLTELVCQWECLSNACEQLGLKEASAKLEEVFPLLAKGRKKPVPPEPVTIEE